VDHLEPERRPDESADPPVEPEPDPRRYPSTIGGAFYLLVLAGSAVGLGIVSHGNWRLGVKWVASSLVFAALVRLVLPTRDAGMLAVRRRFVDVLLLTVVGAILWFLSGSIPNQPSP
jgi:hypothetical protein